MKTYNLAGITKVIYDSKLKLLSTTALRSLLKTSKESTFFSLVNRLVKNNILLRLEKGKYLVVGANVHEFGLANFLYSRSYVSFESALNFCGILSQFPYEITSVTSRQTTEKKNANKIFGYYHLKKSLFFGFKKQDGFLIASPEKAILDQFYLMSKGIKSLDLDDCDLSILNKKDCKKMSKKFPKTKKFNKLLAEIL